MSAETVVLFITMPLYLVFVLGHVVAYLIGSTALAVADTVRPSKIYRVVMGWGKVIFILLFVFLLLYGSAARSANPIGVTPVEERLLDWRELLGAQFSAILLSLHARIETLETTAEHCTTVVCFLKKDPSYLVTKSLLEFGSITLAYLGRVAFAWFDLLVFVPVRLSYRVYLDIRLMCQ